MQCQLTFLTMPIVQKERENDSLHRLYLMANFVTELKKKTSQNHTLDLLHFVRLETAVS